MAWEIFKIFFLSNSEENDLSLSLLEFEIFCMRFFGDKSWRDCEYLKPKLVWNVANYDSLCWVRLCVWICWSFLKRSQWIWFLNLSISIEMNETVDKNFEIKIGRVEGWFSLLKIKLSMFASFLFRNLFHVMKLRKFCLGWMNYLWRANCTIKFEWNCFYE